MSLENVVQTWNQVYWDAAGQMGRQDEQKRALMHLTQIWKQARNRPRSALLQEPRWIQEAIKEDKARQAIPQLLRPTLSQLNAAMSIEFRILEKGLRKLALTLGEEGSLGAVLEEIQYLKRHINDAVQVKRLVDTSQRALKKLQKNPSSPQIQEWVQVLCGNNQVFQQGLREGNWEMFWQPVPKQQPVQTQPVQTQPIQTQPNIQKEINALFEQLVQQNVMLQELHKQSIQPPQQPQPVQLEIPQPVQSENQEALGEVTRLMELTMKQNELVREWTSKLLNLETTEDNEDGGVLEEQRQRIIELERQLSEQEQERREGQGQEEQKSDMSEELEELRNVNTDQQVRIQELERFIAQTPISQEEYITQVDHIVDIEARNAELETKLATYAGMEIKEPWDAVFESNQSSIFGILADWNSKLLPSVQAAIKKLSDESLVSFVDRLHKAFKEQAARSYSLTMSQRGIIADHEAVIKARNECQAELSDLAKEKENIESHLLEYIGHSEEIGQVQEDLTKRVEELYEINQELQEQQQQQQQQHDSMVSELNQNYENLQSQLGQCQTEETSLRDQVQELTSQLSDVNLRQTGSHIESSVDVWKDLRDSLCSVTQQYISERFTRYGEPLGGIIKRIASSSVREDEYEYSKAKGMEDAFNYLVDLQAQLQQRQESFSSGCDIRTLEQWGNYWIEILNGLQYFSVKYPDDSEDASQSLLSSMVGFVSSPVPRARPSAEEANLINQIQQTDVNMIDEAFGALDIRVN